MSARNQELTDGKNQTTRWNYDEYGRVTNKLDQTAVEILRYTYDADGRLASRWSTAKGTTYYTNDPVGNLTAVNHPASHDITFGYDALDRVTNMVDAAGTTTYAYAIGGQLWTEDGPWSNDTVTNIWNNRLRVGLALQQPSGVWTNQFSYDLPGEIMRPVVFRVTVPFICAPVLYLTGRAKRLTNVTSPAGAFGYSFVGQASRLTQKLALPNTSYITNTYDPVARLLSTTLKNSSHTTLNGHTYAYNVGNQRTQQTFNSGSAYNYTYDPIGQLQVADSATASEDRGYTYDTAWNLNYRTNNTTLNTFKVDGKNQLTNASPVGVQTYDANGNLLGNGGASDRLYLYDDENQLIGIEREEVWRTELVYDGKGRLRVRKEYDWSEAWVLNTETRYLYDGMRVIQERSSSNVPQVSYTRGTDLSGSLEGAGGIGGLLARSHGYSAGNWSTHNYYHADGNGNITYLVNGSQGLAAKYRYDPYGNAISSSGSLASANVYRFSSKEFHSNSGLYYYGYRWYHPNLQRWPNRDPLSEPGFEWLRSSYAGGQNDHLNLYVFVTSDPVYKIDALGLHTFKGCLRQQEDNIKAALRDLCKKAKECGDKCPSGGFPIGVREVCEGNITFNCVHKDFEMGDGLSCKTHCGMARGKEIFLCPSTARCGGLACVIFHEAGHVGGLPGNPKTPHPRPDFDTFAKCMGCPVTW